MYALFVETDQYFAYFDVHEYAIQFTQLFFFQLQAASLFLWFCLLRGGWRRERCFFAFNIFSIK